MFSVLSNTSYQKERINHKVLRIPSNLISLQILLKARTQISNIFDMVEKRGGKSFLEYAKKDQLSCFMQHQRIPVIGKRDPTEGRAVFRRK